MHFTDVMAFLKTSTIRWIGDNDFESLLMAKSPPYQNLWYQPALNSLNLLMTPSEEEHTQNQSLCSTEATLLQWTSVKAGWTKTQLHSKISETCHSPNATSMWPRSMPEAPPARNLLMKQLTMDYRNPHVPIIKKQNLPLHSQSIKLLRNCMTCKVKVKGIICCRSETQPMSLREKRIRKVKAEVALEYNQTENRVHSFRQWDHKDVKARRLGTKRSRWFLWLGSQISLYWKSKTSRIQINRLFHIPFKEKEKK